MKKLIAIAAMAIFGFSANAQNATEMDLPNTPVKQMNGSSIPFNQSFEKGKVTLVSFWATWCIPCKKEIIAVRNNMESWKKEVDFNYVTVSVDDSRATAQVKAYAKSQGWDFPYYQDPNSDLKRSLNFQNVPFSIIVGKDGKIAYMQSGYEAGGEEILFTKMKEIAAK
ncbi:TlpA family protein disulfide reductase [Taibaiella lutea]|uniref:TlpA family protein disulfide reductase n=1 Tax=Taibaiella lutea TaxID=2608001 RepID=A0A5M6CSM7_9BACT|nr:TlpA disulfide reductase family protein [Taibaiella lutea]KAA5537390.1 TlpA family protein disulfide reductase [Taibaiella lutea]